MKNTTFFAILGFFIAFIPLEIQANDHIKHQRTEKFVFSDNKQLFCVETDSLWKLIELCILFGKPESQMDYDAWRDFGEEFDLYLYPPDKPPLTRNTIVFFHHKDFYAHPDGLKDQLKNLDLVYTGRKFIEVVLNVFEQVEEPSVEIFFKALNYYKEKNEFMEIKS